LSTSLAGQMAQLMYLAQQYMVAPCLYYTSVSK
jgi:hypothetical protein